MKLHNEKSVFIAFIEGTAALLNINTDIVEKDYWITYALKKLFIDERVVLKGGTSLFKGYDFINRFSEDIDVTFKGSITDAEIEEIKNKSFDLNFKLIKENKEFEGYQSTSYSYNKLYDQISQNIKTDIVFESYKLTQPQAIESLKIHCLIYKFISKQNNLDLVNEYGLEPFEIKILPIVNTFIDKIFAVNEYIIRGLRSGEYTRHVYDIAKIYENDNVYQLYLSGKIKKIYNKELHKRIKSKNSVIKKDFDLSTSKLKNLFNKNFKDDFSNFQKEMVFEGRRIDYFLVEEIIIKICNFSYK